MASLEDVIDNVGMSSFIRRIFTIVIYQLTFIILVIIFTLIACNSETFPPSNSETQYPTTSSTTLPSTTTHKPTGVAGSTLLPVNAPEADHFIGGGGCFEHHGIPPKHGVEVQNQFACDRCHVQTSTLLPTITPSIIPN